MPNRADHTPAPETLVVRRQVETRAEQERAVFTETDSLDTFERQIDRVVSPEGITNNDGSRTYTRAEIYAAVAKFKMEVRAVLAQVRPEQLTQARAAFRRQLLSSEAARITSAAELRITLVDTAINERLASGKLRSEEVPPTIAMRVEGPRRPRTERPFTQTRTVTEVMQQVKQLYQQGEAMQGPDGKPLSFDQVKQSIISGVKAVEDSYKAVALTGGQLSVEQIRSFLQDEVGRNGRILRAGISPDLGLQEEIIRIVTDTYQMNPLPRGVILSSQRAGAERAYRINLKVEEPRVPLPPGARSELIISRSLVERGSTPAATEAVLDQPVVPEIPREEIVQLQTDFLKFVRGYGRLHARHTPQGSDHSIESIWTSNEATRVAMDLEKQLAVALGPRIKDLQRRFPGRTIDLPATHFNLTIQDRPTPTQSRLGRLVSGLALLGPQDWSRRSEEYFNLTPRTVAYTVTFDQKYFNAKPV